MKQSIFRRNFNLARTLLAAFCVLAFASPGALLFAEDATQAPTLHVAGEGVVAVPLRYARITLSVTSTQKTAALAQADTAKRADRVVQALQGAGVQDLKTQSIALRTITRDKKTGRIVEYFSSNTMSFRVAIEAAGRMLDRCVEAGANNINQVQLVPDDADLAAARKDAMAAAALDAREKADIVLSALGLRAKVIRQINVDMQFGAPTPMRMQRMSEASTPVVGGDAQVRATVRLAVGY
ncbi:MAG: SIMPL domain-containing protein [bacterium]|nr:SIMPL domain-containing protein [bacterium]